MSTIRVSKDRNFSIINNTVLNDKRLSWKAKGLAAFLLSKPDDWKIIREHLIKQSADGETAVRTGLQELEECGYLVRTRYAGAHGRFEWQSVLYETPRESSQMSESNMSTPLGDFPPMDNPPMENPPVENQVLLSTELPNTDLLSTEQQKEGEDARRSLPEPPAEPPAPPLLLSANNNNLSVKEEIGKAEEPTAEKQQQKPPPPSKVALKVPAPIVADDPPSRIQSETPTGKPKQAPTKLPVSPHLDPRKLRGGYVPAGTGATAVEVYYERFKASDKTVLTAPLEDDLVGQCPDLDRLRTVIVAYSQHGDYRPGNVKLILDWYRDGIPDKKGTPNRGKENRSNSTRKPDDAAIIATRPDLAAYSHFK